MPQLQPRDKRAKCRLAIVTNIPAPYRVPVYNLLAKCEKLQLLVIYCARRESNRQWDLPPFEHDHQFLRENVNSAFGRYIHNNRDVASALASFGPNVTITTGFNPTHLYAVLYSLLAGAKHVTMSDGTLESESSLSWAHKLVRRLVFGRSQAFIAASAGAVRLFESYGVQREKIFRSPLCVNGTVSWDILSGNIRDIDILFSGRVTAVKNPLFVVSVATATAQRLGRTIKLGVLGDGDQMGEFLKRCEQNADCIEVVTFGFLSQKEIPLAMGRARIFAFPTLWDPWGLVVNEAMMAEAVVIASPYGGVVNDLLIDDETGIVLDLDIEKWALACASVLTDDGATRRLVGAAKSRVMEYSAESAASGIRAATEMAHG